MVFPHLWSCSIDYFNNLVLDGVVICAGDVPSQYNELEDMYMEFSGNTTENVFLAASRDHEFLLSDKGDMSHISNNSIEPTKSNFVENSINLMQISFPIPSDPSHPTYNAHNRDAQAEYLAIIKMASRNRIKDINFMVPVQTKRVHGDLMNEASCEA